MEVVLKSGLGLLAIKPIIPQLKAELGFWHQEVEQQAVSYHDHKLGRTKTYHRRGSKVLSKWVSLCEIDEENQVMVTHDGLLTRIEDLCAKLGIKTKYVRLDPQFVIPRIIRGETAKGLYPEQAACLAALLSIPGGALAQAPTGAGKTRVIAGLIRAYQDHRVVIVTQAMSVVDTLYKTLNSLLNPEGIKIGIMQGARRDKKQITVATIKMLPYFDPEEVDVLIFDEAHRSAADKTSELVMTYKRAVKYGFSATLQDRFDGKELFLEALFGPIVFDLGDEEAEALGRICPIKNWVLTVDEGPDLDRFKTPLKWEEAGIWYNRHRNELIKEVCERAPADQQLVVFVRTIAHLEQLKNKFLPDFEIYHASLPTSQKEMVKTEFESGQLKRLIATNALSEGVDPQHLYILVDANWEASEVSVVQKAGRNRRHAPGKNYGVLVTFGDEWNKKTRKKAQTRTKRFKKRGFTVIENATPQDVQFLDNTLSQKRNEEPASVSV